MATILLSAAGAALGAGFGGTVLGLSGAVIGRAIGATLGRVIDQRLIAGGADPVETGRVDRFRLMGASEGAAVPRLWGRVRVGGQVIWASRFQESVTRSGGGKGMPRPKTEAYSYSISLAIALCEGEILRVGRIWADGNEIAPQGLTMRLYRGTEDQMPDARIEAVEGADAAPAYRGIAYVVIEDLDLTPFGNRVPQFSFEVVRAAQAAAAAEHPGMAGLVPGVCLIPGTGEYSLATTPVHYELAPGVTRMANMHVAGEETDLSASLRALEEELPGCGAVALVAGWFADDLRCGTCQIRPMVEQQANEGVGMPWRAGGLSRAQAAVMPQLDGDPVYGGTPADAAVVEAIAALRAQGKAVTFYPFLLMTQLAGNGRPDPWSAAADQPVLPWRGRITTSKAAGQPGSPDGTAAAEAEVAAFFGQAEAAHFTVSGEAVSYSGPAEWSYRRFILHYARLCALAGGVESFCIGSEMRGLTQVRGAGGSYPAVTALRALAAEVRAILGPGVSLGYAADWSEYFGHHSGGDLRFHLDPLWSDANIDFVGIDNYMPLADWRDGPEHADAGWGSICNPDYLAANIAGGEGFDWYYDDPNGLAAQRRLPIEDGAGGEPWVFRYKDLTGWWCNPHHDRIGGVRQAVATGWQPCGKPIRFVEYGCAAVDKGANQPNRFPDPKSSESGLPRFSDGRRDDLMQLAYLQAMHRHWTDPARNPASPVYGGPMVDFARSHVWAWDARPFPAFPSARGLWSDAANYQAGHWLNGRASGQPLAAVIGEICAASGLGDVEAGAADGMVRGYALGDIGTARSALQPLLVAHGIEAVEREGSLQFFRRDGWPAATIDAAALALSPDLEGALERARAAQGEAVDRVRVSFLEAEGDFAARVAEAAFPAEGPAERGSDAEIPAVLTADEGRALAERLLIEARLAQDTARFALPPSRADLGAGDVVRLEGLTYRIDRLEQGGLRLAEAVRVDAAALRPPAVLSEAGRKWTPYVAPGPVFPLFLDLPLLSGDEVAHAPHLGVAADPWPGAVALWASPSEDGFALGGGVEAPMVLGVTENVLTAAGAGRWDRGPALRVRFEAGALSSVSLSAVLAGANLAAIGNGSAAGWEVFQFAEALMVGPKTWELSLRLRGQAGSDGTMPAQWPAGSLVVMIDRALRQIDLPLAARGLLRNYRIGPASAGYNAAGTVARAEAFDGIGLRPYAPVHLRAAVVAGDLAVGWVRRSRIDGDSWQSVEVPLGEESESYLIRLRQGPTLLREAVSASASWVWTAAMQAADGAAPGPVRLEVAQISQAFGPGPAAVLDLVL
jgi:hypothetical protein